MGIEIYLKLSGLPGASQAAEHRGEIDLESWSWGGNVDSEQRGGRPSKVVTDEVTFMKKSDIASAGLARAAATGARFTEATLTVHEVGGDDLLVLTMNDVQVVKSSYQFTGADNPIEQYWLKFGSFRTKSAAHSQGPSASATYGDNRAS
ncbi:MAG TPA: type VI secretion system tube protein Hcp [Caulobacteraceae bacterium]|jgi:type VI secretion system secreted protein Hcp